MPLEPRAIATSVRGSSRMPHSPSASSVRLATSSNAGSSSATDTRWNGTLGAVPITPKLLPGTRIAGQCATPDPADPHQERRHAEVAARACAGAPSLIRAHFNHAGMSTTPTPAYRASARAPRPRAADRRLRGRRDRRVRACRRGRERRPAAGGRRHRGRHHRECDRGVGVVAVGDGRDIRLGSEGPHPPRPVRVRHDGCGSPPPGVVTRGRPGRGGIAARRDDRPRGPRGPARRSRAARARDPHADPRGHADRCG